MLRREVHKWFRKFFARGSNVDVEKEFRRDGEYQDARDMRVTSVDGNTGSISKVGGEVVRHAPQPGEDGSPYKNILACVVSDDEVSVWASVNPGDPVLFKINGVTMVSSPLIPYVWNRPLQVGNVSNCPGGILFPVDGQAPALFWDIARIKQAFLDDTGEFTTDFNLQSVSVLPAGPEEWMEHVGLPSIGQGFPPGQYQFAFRFLDDAGNSSNIGPWTPLISVPLVQAPVYNTTPADGQYPGGQTTGGAENPDLQVPTPYGIALRFFIDNPNGFAQAEVIMRRLNEGGTAVLGTTNIIDRFPIQSGEFRPYDRVYPRDNSATGTISTDALPRQQLNFTAPAAVEHIDNRVVYANIELEERIVDLQFRDVNGERVFPVTRRVFTRHYNEDYNDGFSDPVNNTYLKSAQHGEVHDIGLMLWDGNASKSPVVDVVRNYQFPLRRTRKTGDSLTYSDTPVFAANTECQSDDPVSATFDAITQGSRGKVRTDFTNIMRATTPGGGGLLNYNPLRPTGPVDPNFLRYRMSPVESRRVQGVTLQPDTGRVFAPEVNSLGIGIYGPTNLREEAPWCRVITVMRSERAGRVVAEGIGTYKLIEGASRKSINELWSFFPDIDSGLVGESVYNDIAANPQNYRVVLTPFGFYSETYAYWNAPNNSSTSRAHDMISYCDVQWDSGQVNVGDEEPQGYQPTFSAPATQTNNIGYAYWRRPAGTEPADSSVFTNPANAAQQGAIELLINNINRTTEGRGRVYTLRLQDNIYRLGSIPGSQSGFDTEATRKFHEPVYVISIIRTGATVPNRNIQQYISTGYHVAVDRCIGIYNTDQGVQQDFELFHARKHDAVGRQVTDFRYAYVRSQGLPERRWVCATNNSFISANFVQIQLDIVANGFWVAPDGLPVYGLYQYIENNDGVRPIGYLRFGSYGAIPTPPDAARIVVKLDDREPILAHGFDCTVAPTTFAPLDRVFNGKLEEDSTPGDPAYSSEFNTLVPLPYSAGRRSDLYLLPRGSNNGGAEIEDVNINVMTSIRQWVVWAHLVTRTQQRMAVGKGEPALHPFPRTHYIMRPMEYVSANSLLDNGVNEQYGNDYPGEQGLWGYGGFRFATDWNQDYDKGDIVTGLGIPRNGQQPKRRLCSAYAASERVNPLAMDLPGLRTFFEDNLYPVSEDNGAINMIHVLDQGGKQMLWGWCERGVHMVPYNKNILTGASGDEIGTQSISNFWPRLGGEVWVARGERGCPGTSWRVAVKAHVALGEGDADMVIWADRVGIYQTVGGQIKDIVRGKRLSKMLPLLRALPDTYTGKYASTYNYKNGEVWMSFPFPLAGGRPTNRVCVYSAINGEWIGEFSYDHDQFLGDESRLIGYSELTSYDLDEGLTMADGSPVSGWVEMPFSPFPNSRTELVAWRIGPDKPDELQVYDREGNLMLVTNEAVNGPLWVKFIDGYEQLMGRTDASYSPDRRRVQDTLFVLRYIHNTAAPFRATFVDVQAKQMNPNGIP